MNARKQGAPLIILGCLLLAAGRMQGQSTGFEIRGVVLEPGLNAGLGGVAVSLVEVDVVDNKLTETPVGSMLTDGTGVFRFRVGHPGDFVVRAAKADYFEATDFGMSGKAVAAVPVRVGPGQPAQDLRMRLTQPGELTGRVVDEEGKPVAKLPVDVTAGPLSGPFAPAPVTNEDGVFSKKRISPGDYLVHIGARAPRVQTAPFTDDDLKSVDRDWETSYWPGGFETPSSRINVGSGASVSVGTLTARKRTYYRAHLTVLGGDCRRGDQWTLFVIRTMAARTDAPRQQRIACGKEFLMKGLAAGSYWFALSNQEFGEEARLALAEVEVRDENVQATLTMTAGATLSGQIVMATSDAKLPPMAGLRIRAVARESGVQEETSGTLDAEGRFVLRNLWPRQFAGLTGLDARYYVQEMRLNGAPVQNFDLLLSPGAESRLEIVVSDQTATLAGTVTSDGPDGVPVTIVLERVTASGEPERHIVPVGQAGIFQVVGLPPGEYRVLAMPGSDWLSGRTDEITRLLARAQTVRLDPGGRQSITLKLTDPSR